MDDGATTPQHAVRKYKVQIKLMETKASCGPLNLLTDNFTTEFF
jgi:hypothetical protein